MENTNERTRKAHLNKINEVLKIAVPQFDELGLKKDRQGTPHLEVRYKHWRPRGAKQEEFQFSDGTLRLIGFMWALLDGTETILLEEPELHLHAELIKRLPEFISKLQRRRKSNIRQVIITTHSYDLLSHPGIGADEVIFLAPRDEGTEAKRVDSAEDCVRYLEAGFSVADAVIPRTAPENLENL
jgi:predicted ATPase